MTRSLKGSGKNIIDLIESYYVQNRTPEQVADSLDKRITLYIQENY